jgi:hypothetical protein
MDKTILNCYTDSYLNTPLNIVHKIQEISLLPELVPVQPTAASELKFKPLRAARKGGGNRKVQYLSQFLRDRGLSRDRRRRYEEHTLPEPFKAEPSEFGSELAVIPERLKKKKKARMHTSEKIYYRSA